MARAKSVKAIKDPIPSEHHEQTVFVTWVRKQGYRIISIPNGVNTNFVQACRLKASGLTAGFPDLFIPIVTPKFHGMFIEMKRRKGGKLTDAQVEWLSFLRDSGYFAEVANGADEAKKMFFEYMLK
jgi:hypothetical protein